MPLNKETNQQYLELKVGLNKQVHGYKQANRLLLQ